MKKEASVILAKCAQDKLYGIRIEKRDNEREGRTPEITRRI